MSHAGHRPSIAFEKEEVSLLHLPIGFCWNGYAEPNGQARFRDVVRSKGKGGAS